MPKAMNISLEFSNFANIISWGLAIFGTKIVSVAAQPVWQNNPIFLDIFFPFGDQSCYFIRTSFYQNMIPKTRFNVS